MRRLTPLAVLILCLSAWVVDAVDRSKFKNCDQSSFCKRHRSLHEKKSALSYSITPSTFQLNGAELTAEIKESRSNTLYTLQLIRLEQNIVRLRINEKNPLTPRYEVKEAVLEKQIKQVPFRSFEADTNTLILDDSTKLVIEPTTVRLDLYVNNELSMSANSRSLFYFEYLRPRATPFVAPENEPVIAADAAGHIVVPADDQIQDDKVLGVTSETMHEKEGHPTEELLTTTDDPEYVKTQADELDMTGAWEEHFSTHKDDKLHGPQSIGMDFSFVGAKHVYGIPEHATDLSLPATRGPNIKKDPFRLFNADVFEYELNNEMALYGAVPLMISHSEKRTNAILWLNAAETWIDIEKPFEGAGGVGEAIADAASSLLNKLFSKDNKPLDRVDTHWMSETGIIDTFFLPGPTPTDVFDQYKYLTGGQFMPPMFSLGYHQCRWNYRDEDDVSQVNAGFEEHNIPMDVMWLDIEHTDQKKYFTWDNRHFPTPEDMQKSLESYGRKMVTIVDPHIKRDKGYYVHDEATEKGYYVKNNNGETDYEGWCWPGSSSWLDFLREDVRDYWADQFKLDKYKGSTANLYTWNDMNEPSVFNGPEVSMHRDAKHMHGKVEHRDVHNQYGFYMTMGTHEGHLRRSNGLSRPFVLTRAFYSGSQRYASVWTGDNTATWAHLKASLPMIMSLNIAGISFSGADVGGFFGNPDAELLARWYQTAAFTPFFREHGHIDTKRREPWLFGQPYLDVIREAIRLRYQLLPYWYTLFEGAHSKLHPIVRPMFVEFPADAQTFSMEDQMMVGSALLVKPVTDAGATTIDVYLPHGTWYEWKTQKAYQGQGATITLRTPLEYIPIFVRGGSIVPLKERSRRSTHQMVNDPYTLIVALDDKKAASGELYIDDGESFNYEKGASIRRGFTYTTAEDGTSAHLVSAALSDNKMYLRNKIEKIVVLGVAKAPSSININGQALTFEHDSNKGKLVIRKPDVLVSQGWDVQIQF